MVDFDQYERAKQAALQFERIALEEVLENIPYGMNALILHAARHHDVAMAQALVALYPSGRFEAALFEAARTGDLDMMEALADSWDHDPDNILMGAVESDSQEAVQWALSRVTSTPPQSILRAAARTSLEMLRTLLPLYEAGDMERVVETACAVSNNDCCDMTRLILRHSPDSNCAEALHMAIFNGQEEAAMVMIEAGAQFDHSNNPTNYLSSLELSFDFSGKDKITRALVEAMDPSQFDQMLMNKAARSLSTVAVDLLYPFYTGAEIDDILLAIDLPRCHLAQKRHQEIERQLLHDATLHLGQPSGPRSKI